jgi:RNA polymerase sigma-70 factor (ECF subfamily)
MERTDVSDSIGELIGRCRAGDTDAVSELVLRYRAWAIHVAARAVGDADLSEDVAQESFLTALASLENLREPGSFLAWFRKIIRTQACRMLRNSHEASLLVDDLEDFDPGPEASALAEEMREHILRAMQAIPPAGREAADLFYMQEMNCTEISGLLNIPTGTVKRRLHDARIRLRGILLDYITESDERGMK